MESKDELRDILNQLALRTPWFPPPDIFEPTNWNVKMLLLKRSADEAEEFTKLFAEFAPPVASNPERSFVNWEEVKEMQAGQISFGSHTLNHVLLPTTKPSTAQAEISQSREELRERLGEEPCGFAYPWGALGPCTLDQVHNTGYDFAVTITPGVFTKETNPYLIPRIPLSDSILDGGQKAFSAGKARVSFAKNIMANPPNEELQSSHQPPNKKVKILYVLDQITEWEGGTERQLKTLINSLDRDAFQPELCFLLPTRVLPEDSYPCPAHWVRQGDEPGNLFTRLWGLTSLIRTIRPDIVQTFFQEGLILGTLASWLNEIPVRIVSVRNSHGVNAIHRGIMRSIKGLSTLWQCNSPSLLRYTSQQYGVAPERIEILPNGLDLSQFNPATPQEKTALRGSLGLRPDGPIFVYVANLTPVKDFGTLVRAAAKVKPHFPAAQYVLVGDGPSRKEIQELAQSLGVGDAIKLTGRVADVRPYLAAADFGLQTSQSEGSSNSLLEYMAMGLPSIVSDISPNRDLVAGVFFQTSNANDLADKIRQLAGDRNWQERLVRQYRETVAEFSLEKYANRVQSFYTRMAQCRP
jgi:glycosyltransferase involved in cell wall biosynthesis